MAYIFDLVDTWASGGGPYTSIKMNATDNDVGSASLLMDLQVGGSSRFSVNKSGHVNTSRFIATPFGNTAGIYLLNTSGVAQAGMFAGFGGVPVGFTLNNTGVISWDSSTAATTGTPDVLLTRRAAANLRLGAADAASGVQAQTLSVQSITGTNASAAAYPFKITGAQGTGTGAGGSIIFQVAPAGGAGPAQNTLVDALTIGADRNPTLWGNGSGYYFEAASGFEYFGSGTIAVRAAGARPMAWKVTNQAVMVSNGLFGWASGAAEGTAIDTILARDAANTLALRNGANAQQFNVYKSYTDASNYSRLAMFASGGGNFVVQSQIAGTGVGGTLFISTATANDISFQTASTVRMTIGSGGGVTLADAQDIAVGTTTGTKIGTATTQKIAFFNSVPVVQPTAVADATDAATVITQLNALLTRMRNLGLIAT